jgi:ribosomal protein S18 acetylase RimI-like enzyme
VTHMGKVVTIREYRQSDETAWLRCWGQVTVSSHAWGLPAHQKKPAYERPAVELVVIEDQPITPGVESGGPTTRTGPEATVVGFIDVEIEAKPAELGFFEDSPCGFVWELGLLPDHRGRSLGRDLVTAAANRLREQGIQRMEFWSMDENAQRFYEHLGMAEINRHWRFWVRPDSREDAASVFLAGPPGEPRSTRAPAPPSLRIELACATASVADWPVVRSRAQVVETPPLEPHLCRGFDYRF